MIEDYRKLLDGLDDLFTADFINDVDKLTDKEVAEKMKQVIKTIETYTNLDLYNQFSDLYNQGIKDPPPMLCVLCGKETKERYDTTALCDECKND